MNGLLLGAVLMVATLLLLSAAAVLWWLLRLARQQEEFDWRETWRKAVEEFRAAGKRPVE